MSLPVEESASDLKRFENHVNKWTQELLEQERDFKEKAMMINEWDGIIKENSHSLNGICQTVKNVMISQKQINEDLNFIKAQQKELEAVVTAMESDPNRVQTLKNEDQRTQLYELAESIDSTMKRLSEDLKEVIDTVNEDTMRGYNPNDPILQIRRILNANVNSLKWIDDYTSKIKTIHEKMTTELEEKLDEERTSSRE